MKRSRREFSISAAAILGAAVTGKSVKGKTPENSTYTVSGSNGFPVSHGRAAAEKTQIGMLVYPGMFLQDLTGPLAVFESLMNREIHLIWKTRDPISTGGPIPVTPTRSFREVPAKLDVLFVPGGLPGTLQMMQDSQVLGFLSEMAPTAKYVTSVCTGSLILGAAGLLKGYRAATYWSAMDALKEFGAIPTAERVVVDRNRVTGGGVTAGIDFGLTLVAMLRDRTYAEAVQLYLEYDPHPPFSSGSPKTASKEARALIDSMLGPSNAALMNAAKKALKQ